MTTREPTATARNKRLRLVFRPTLPILIALLTRNLCSANQAELPTRRTRRLKQGSRRQSRHYLRHNLFCPTLCLEVCDPAYKPPSGRMPVFGLGTIQPPPRKSTEAPGRGLYLQQLSQRRVALVSTRPPATAPEHRRTDWSSCLPYFIPRDCQRGFMCSMLGARGTPGDRPFRGGGQSHCGGGPCKSSIGNTVGPASSVRVCGD